MLTDTGYQGLQKRHANSHMPKKKTKKHPLTPEDKHQNNQLSSQCALNENVNGVAYSEKFYNQRRS